MNQSNHPTVVPATAHKSMTWLCALAWLANLAIALMPVLAHVFDPIPPIAAADTGNLFSVGRYVLESAVHGLQHIWVLFVIAGLAVLVPVVLLIALLLNRNMRPLRRLVKYLGPPAVALPVALAIAVAIA